MSEQPKLEIIERVIYQALSDEKTRSRVTEVVSLYGSNDEAEQAEWRVEAKAIAARLHDTLGLGSDHCRAHAVFHPGILNPDERRPIQWCTLKKGHEGKHQYPKDKLEASDFVG